MPDAKLPNVNYIPPANIWAHVGLGWVCVGSVGVDFGSKVGSHWSIDIDTYLHAGGIQALLM